MKGLGAILLAGLLILATSAASAQYRFGGDGAKSRSQSGASNSSTRGGGNAAVQRNGGRDAGIGSSRVNRAISGHGRGRGGGGGRGR